MKPSRNYKKEPLAAEFKNSKSKAAVFGHGVVLYCETRKCWVLPEGPNQKRVEVYGFGEALEFAKSINTLISSYSPALALRLKKAA